MTARERGERLSGLVLSPPYRRASLIKSPSDTDTVPENPHDAPILLRQLSSILCAAPLKSDYRSGACSKLPPGRGQSANTALRRRFRLSVGCSGSEIRRSIKLYIAAVVNWYAGVFCLSVNERSGRPESRSDRQSVSGGLTAEKALNFFRPFLASA